MFFNFNGVVLDGRRVRLGNYTLFGPGVQILTPMHPMNAELRRRVEYGKLVEVGADVWVGGAAALILAGGRRQRRHPGRAGRGLFAAGKPCRVIREITE